MRFSFFNFLLLCLGFCFAGWIPVSGQALAESAVPSSVRSSFVQSNPGIKAVWSKSGSGYEAVFSKQSKQYAFVYNSAGQLQLKKMAFTGNTLPESVKGKVSAQYNLAEVSDAWQVMNREKQTYYEVIVSSPDTLTRLRYSSAGQLLSRASKAQPSSAVAAKDPAKPAGVITPKEEPKPNVVAANPPVSSGNSPKTQPAVAMRGESATQTQPVKTEIYEEDYEFEADLEEEEEEVFEEDDLTLPDDEDDWDMEEEFEEEEDDADIDSIGTDDDL